MDGPKMGLAAQTDQDFEVIIVNDAGCDVGGPSWLPVPIDTAPRPSLTIETVNCP